jgi:phage terminase small subunit
LGGSGSGRNPEPAELKVLKGRRPGKDSGGRSITLPPPFRRLAPEKPAELSPEASTHWDAITPEPRRLELLSPQQIGGLVMLCEIWAIWKAATEPQVKIAASKEYRLWATQFGLTPSAEGRLKPREANDGQGDNPFAPRSADLAGS